MQLIVLGMHRSGTSTVARVLNMMGAYFAPPEQAMPPSAANAKGYWEREDIRQLNDVILQDLGYSWDNLADLDPTLLDSKLLARHSSALRKIVYELDAHRPWMAKDPRFCLLLPIWEAVLEVPVYIYVYRQPLQIAKSLAVRENNTRSITASSLYPIEQAAYLKDVAYFPLSLGFALWEKYTLGALSTAKDIPKIPVSYHDLMRQPLETVSVLYEQLEACGVCGLRMPSKREIRAFIDPSLHHQKDGDALQNAYMNPQQLELARTFQDGGLLKLDRVPPLSAGAQDVLNEHRDRLLAARQLIQQSESLKQQQAHIATQQEQIEQQQAQIATKDRQLADYTRQLQRATEDTDSLSRNWRQAQAQLAAKETLLAHKEAEKEALLAQKETEKAALVAGSEAERQQFLAEKEQLIHRFNTLVHWVDGLETDIDAIFDSLTWRAGDLITRGALKMMLRKPGATAKDHIEAVRQYLAQYKTLSGRPPAAWQIHASMQPPARESAQIPARAPVKLPSRVQSTRDYEAWVKQYDVQDKTTLRRLRQQAKDWQNPPLISVVMPVYNTSEKHLQVVLDSVLAQVYSHWELCIADDASTLPHVRRILKQYAVRDKRIKLCFRDSNGHISAATNSALELVNGEFVAFIDHDDALAPYALFAVAKAVQQHPDAMLLYSDEDKIDEYGKRQTPHFKPAWNPALLLSYNYLNHLAVYRASLLWEVGGLREGFEGAQDYDLALRSIEKISAAQIVHIPLVLYHWRISAGSTAAEETQKPYALQAARRAIAGHWQRIGVQAEVSDAPELLGANRAHYLLPENPPLVSLIIPTYNGLDLLRQCMASIRRKTDYPNYEILIIDNRSDDPATLDYLDELERSEQAKILRYPHPFNYAAINNMAVQHARGELLCLLNNDIEVITPGWLSEMVGHALQADVGAVGARLWYPNETLQHGGVIVGLGGVAGHSHKYFPRGNSGYFGRAVVIQNLSAVTAACMVLRKETYFAANGMEETQLRVAFNDVDFCLRIGELGLRIVWTPYAELYHHESVSRGQEDTPEKIARFQQECTYIKNRWGQGLLQDPAYSPNLTLDTEDFAYAWPPRVPGLSEQQAAARIIAPASIKPKSEIKKLPSPSTNPPRALPPQQIQSSAPVTPDNGTPPAAIPPHLQHRQPGYALLKGDGLEVGAFNQPATLPAGCRIEYGDAHSKQEISQYFKEIDPSGLVEVQHVFDLDTQGLSLFQDQVYDFVVLNHVLEHVANPIQIVKEVFRVLKPGGQAVLSIPDKRFTFDKHRPLTSFEHLLEECEAGVTSVSDEHYLDFLHAVHPAVFNLSREELAQCVESSRNRREHAHVWDSASFEQFLLQAMNFLDILAEPVFVSRGEQNGCEYFSVWRKIAE